MNHLLTRAQPCSYSSERTLIRSPLGRPSFCHPNEDDLSAMLCGFRFTLVLTLDLSMVTRTSNQA
uniref:Uncharacterized protein n=1 Tax=Picea sitchensis TaxID=3332 RepID=A0A6B9XV58_PICSI|nr:hypothetical protein Q903MT_gene4045 [Picea sitchensis]